MPETYAVTVIPITAIFRVSQDGAHQLEMIEQIETKRGMNQIVITLITEPATGPAATFADTPPGSVCWLDSGGMSIPTPPSFQVSRQDRQLTIWDLNATAFTTIHLFWLVVQYEGRFYYKDPTIINQKPG